MGDNTILLEAATAERQMVGACMTNPKAREAIFEIIKPSNCALLRHRWILEAIQELLRKGQPVDIAGVEVELKVMGKLDDVGGDVYLFDLFKDAKHQFTFDNLAEMVLEQSGRRQAMEVSDTLKQLAGKQELSLNTILAETRTQLDKLSAQMDIRPPELIGIAASNFFDRLERLESAQGENRLYTGFADLDSPKLIGGFKPGDFVLIGGDTGMGKTSLAVSMAINMAKEGKIGLWESMEMEYDEIIKRFSSALSGVPLTKLRGYSEAEKERFSPMRNMLEMTAHERSAYVAAMGELSELPIVLKYMPTLSPADVWSEARSLKRRGGYLDYIFVDLVTNMRPSDKDANKRDRGRPAELEAIGNQLKAMAVNLECVVFGLSQLKSDVHARPLDKRRPRIGEFANSRNLGNEADIHLFVYRHIVYDDSYEYPNEAELLVRKHRDGPKTEATNFCKIYFDTQCARYTDTTYRNFSPNMDYDKRVKDVEL